MSPEQYLNLTRPLDELDSISEAILKRFITKHSSTGTGTNSSVMLIRYVLMDDLESFIHAASLTYRPLSKRNLAIVPSVVKNAWGIELKPEFLAVLESRCTDLLPARKGFGRR